LRKAKLRSIYALDWMNLAQKKRTTEMTWNQ